MEDSDEFRWAVKVVIKRQMRDLMEQLRERGEEIAILTVNLDDNTFSHFGSPSGEWFVSEQKNLAQNFLKFCKVKGQKGNQNVESISTGTFSSPKSSIVKQRSTQSTVAPTLTVTVPKQLAGDITEEELASLVGRIVASQLAVQGKGDGSSSGTKFDLLVEAAANVKKNEGTSSVVSTPSTRSTRKRKMSQRYKEGISSLKKGKKTEEDDTGSEYETGHDEHPIISILAELSTTILKRVKVKTSEEVPVSIEKNVLAKKDQLENLAVPLIQELDEIAGGLLTKEKLVQVVVYINEYSDLFDNVNVELHGKEGKKKPVESDPEFEVNFELNDNCYGDSDMEDDLPEQPQPPKLTSIEDDLKILKEAVLKHERTKTRKRPKKKTPLSKITPYPCEHCGKKLIGRGNLVAHIKRIHYNQRDHKCIVCPKAFVTTSALESHMLAVHTRRCEACQEYVIESEPWPEGTDMKTKRSLTCQCGANVEIYCHFGRKKCYDDDEEQEKKRKYKDNTRFACQYCGKLFLRKSHCVRHTKLHTKSKDIVCKYCTQVFRWEASLKRHVEKVHKMFQDFYCKICKQTFVSSIELETHFKEKHNPDTQGGTPDVSPNKTGTKVITKDVKFPVQKFDTFGNESRTNLQSYKEACDKEAAGNQQSTINVGKLTSLPGTSFKAGESTVTLSRATEEALDKTAYELVQQALQRDEMFGGGNTIIIRTIND